MNIHYIYSLYNVFSGNMNLQSQSRTPLLIFTIFDCNLQNSFLYFCVLKCQIFVSRFLNYQVLTREFLMYVGRKGIIFSQFPFFVPLKFGRKIRDLVGHKILFKILFRYFHLCKKSSIGHYAFRVSVIVLAYMMARFIVLNNAHRVQCIQVKTGSLH